MTHAKQINFRLTPELREALDTIKDRDGIPLSEQLRRALQLWVESRQVPPPSKRGKR